ncbi:TetR/AcrR family transcriptional regulator [Arthrobacter sp. NicSoilB8]|uniref:TetR/AcrR family transcriptional regulator n=1 Tax=Arthrobacter sp. NicSoilB8 TaxID=2830998 RepID=UPI001CC659B3|nr:TetR/AcrR family transcriptional regulator [Arthrobacter sp. NicSoilB8]
MNLPAPTETASAASTPAAQGAPAAALHAAPNRGRRAARLSGDERQRAILMAAERLLGEKDFADVTIDDLARGAGISRPTFYFYFASKQAVLLALLDQVAHEAEKRTAEVFADLSTAPSAAWRKAIEAFVGTFAEHRGVSVAAAGARSSEPELAAEWATLTNRWIDATAAAIQDERDRGASPAGPEPRLLASALNLLNERVITAALTGLDPARPDQMGRDQMGQDQMGQAGPAAALPGGGGETVGETVETLLHIWLTSIYGAVPAGP